MTGRRSALGGRLWKSVDASGESTESPSLAQQQNGERDPGDNELFRGHHPCEACLVSFPLWFLVCRATPRSAGSRDLAISLSDGGALEIPATEVGQLLTAASDPSDIPRGNIGDEREIRYVLGLC